MTISECSVVITLTVLLAIQPAVCHTQSTYFVKPTPDTPCPSEPCLTLSEFAQGTGPLFTSNTTMVFLPGDHRLYNDMEITNITTFTMVGDSPTLPDITSNIVCTGPAVFTFHNISYLKIQALELSYCGSATLAAMLLIAIPQFELSNSTFYNSRNTSLRATGSGLAITESRFHGSSGAGLVLSQCTAEFLGSSVFSNNLRGGVHSYKSIIMFNGTTSFVNNSGKSGGGIYAASTSIYSDGLCTTITKTEIIGESRAVRCDGEIRFVHNSAEYGGGICAVLGSDLKLGGNLTFMNNSATYGGGIYVVHSRLSCEGITSFVSNSAAAEFGGGIFVLGSQVKLSGNTTFTGNLAQFGGGMFVQQSNASVKGYTSFVNNFAHHGGGLRAQYSTVTFEGINSFTNNLASLAGGGIHIGQSWLRCEGLTSFVSNSAEIGGGIGGYNGSHLTFTENTSFISNTAEYLGGGIYVYQSNANVKGYASFVNNFAYYGGGLRALYSTVTFENKGSNNNSAAQGGGVALENSRLNLKGFVGFIDNSATFDGGGIIAVNSTVIGEGTCTFKNNLAGYFGGGVALDNGSNLTLTGSITFIRNIAPSGAGIFLLFSSLTCKHYTRSMGNLSEHDCDILGTLSNSVKSEGMCIFMNNSAELGGGVSAIWESRLNFSGNTIFTSNLANSDGGGIYVQDSSLTFYVNTNFMDNLALNFNGGGLCSRNSSVTCEGICSFINNSARKSGGGVMSDFGSDLTFNENTTFASNSATWGGGILAEDNSSLYFKGCVNISYNTAGAGGGLYTLYSTVNFGNGSSTIFTWNAAQLGGAVLAGRGAALTVIGISSFTNNTAGYSGGALHMLGSHVLLHGSTEFIENSASYGGSIYIDNSILKVAGSTYFHNNTATNGGGIHGTMATITINGNTTFEENYAMANGGGLSLSSSSQCFLTANETMHFINNHAEQYGGAIYIADDPFVYCSSLKFEDPNLWGECFFQHQGSSDNTSVISIITNNTSSVHEVIIAISFISSNTAGKAGGAVFGGMVDRCKFEPFGYFNPGEVFNAIFEINEGNATTSVMSSDPYQVCPCSSGQPDCSIHSINITVYPGETSLVPVVAVGQRNGTVPAVVKSSLEDERSMLASLQAAQSVNNTCTTLRYSVYSQSSKETMTLTAEGPCLELGEPLIINITLLQCPIGFMLSSSTKGCTCEKRLQKYTNVCNITSRTIDCDGDFWVGVDNGFGGTILHPHCPFDYCKSHPVSFTLNETDLVCSYDRTGLLCGGCQPGLSNVLGSSRCIKCSGAYLSLLIPFALAGIALVAFLLLCKLTVTVGSINGLIFYANIIAVNHSVFLPSGQRNVLTIFIAWLNFDLGIETCFYDGMDTYARTWLQFVFPLYVWVIIGTIVILSHYYGAIARMFGRNPIAVLATLFLLSYAKLLRTIIAVFSFTYLEYPDGAEVAVWLYDGNVRYLKGKHIPLFFTALLVLLLLFLPYTLLLLFGQWIQAHSEKRIFSWISNYRVKPILDAYHAPYRDEYRYWPGLLLVLRCILFLVFAFNILGNPNVNLLVTSVCITALLILTRFTGKVYTNRYLDAIDALYLLNIGVLASGTLYVRSAGGRQEILVYTSISIAFTTFIGILVYHIITQTRDSRVWREVIWPTLQRKRQQTATSLQREPPDTDTQGTEPEIVSADAPTTTYVNLRELLLEDNS